MIWAFGINLTEPYKIKFEEWLKSNCVDSAARKEVMKTQPKKPRNSDSEDSQSGSEQSYQATHVMAGAGNE